MPALHHPKASMLGCWGGYWDLGVIPATSGRNIPSLLVAEQFLFASKESAITSPRERWKQELVFKGSRSIYFLPLQLPLSLTLS